ncbi:MAG TPA: hypothetical protein VGG39_36745 [Polyangiaceae bacterium]
MATSRADAADALAVLRAARREPPASGPNHAAEAARDRATAIFRALDAGNDAFFVECLEEAAAGLDAPNWEDEADVCLAILDAIVGRRCPGAETVLERIAMHPHGTWLHGVVMVRMGRWDAARFAPIMRKAALTHPDEFVRALAAEELVIAGQATPAELDAFLADASHDMRIHVSRGLAERGNPDAIRRLAPIALYPQKDERWHEQANVLLRYLGVMPARGGSC